MGFRHVNDREPSFIAHLPGPHLTRSCRAFSTTFKTTVFSQRPLPWFRAFFRKTALEGQQTSISHAAPQSTRPPFPSRLASCVRVHNPHAPHAISAPTPDHLWSPPQARGGQAAAAVGACSCWSIASRPSRSLGNKAPVEHRGGGVVALLEGGEPGSTACGQRSRSQPAAGVRLVIDPSGGI